MGSAVSSGIDNNDLVDNLVRANYIRTLSVERSFRAVDRGFYLLPQNSLSAYRDTAWKNGNLHISAPCIYSEVLENLQLGPGMSFLNIGSGTGYLSTMAGLLLGGRGVNHGIELHDDVVRYANTKLAEFKRIYPAIDMEDFCEPVFATGNVLNIENPQLYDRIYCGAACPATEIKFLHNLLKVGGILVVPCQDDLLKIVRKTDTLWEGQTILPVSFATLRIPNADEKRDKVFLPTFRPLSLQDMCRSSIRKCIREKKVKEMPEILESMKRVEKLYKPVTEEMVENNNNRNSGVFVMNGLEEVIRNRSQRRGSSIVFMHRVLDNYVNRRNHVRNHMEQEGRGNASTSDNGTNSSNSEREVTRQDASTDHEENSDRMEVDEAEETTSTEDAPVAETTERVENERSTASGSSSGVRGERRPFHRIHGRIYAPHNYRDTETSESVGTVRSTAVATRPRRTPTVVTYSLATMGPTAPINFSMVGMRTYGLGQLRSRNATPGETRESPVASSSGNVRKKSDSEADSPSDQESVKRMKVDNEEEKSVGDVPAEKVEADSLMESNENIEASSHDSRMSDLSRERLMREKSCSIVTTSDSDTGDNNSTESTPSSDTGDNNSTDSTSSSDTSMDQSDTIEEASNTCVECGVDTSVNSSMEENDGSTQSPNEPSTSGNNSRSSGFRRRADFTNRGIAILTINSSDSSDGESSSSGDDSMSQDVTSVLRSIRMRMLDEINVSRRLARLNNNYNDTDDGDIIIERRSMSLREAMRGNIAQREINSAGTSTGTEPQRMDEYDPEEWNGTPFRRRRCVRTPIPNFFDARERWRMRNPGSRGSSLRSADDPVEIYNSQVHALKNAIRDGIKELPLPSKMKSYLDFYRNEIM